LSRAPKQDDNYDGFYYYFGEFGFLNLEIVGGLQRYFKVNNVKRILVYTYENYALLLESLFPNNVHTIVKPWRGDKTSGAKYRNGHMNEEEDRLAVSLYPGSINLSNITTRKKREKLGYTYLEIIPPIIPFSHEKKEKDKYISIFPRYRKASPHRNINEQKWREIIEVIRKYHVGEIVLHGEYDEILNINTQRLIRPKSILEQVYYLNNSVCSICPDSGFAHFSLNCKCDTFVIGKNYWTFSFFNPFRNRLKIIRNDSSRINSELSFFLSHHTDSLSYKIFYGVASSLFACYNMVMYTPFIYELRRRKIA
jgi:hypothetical protein